MSDLVHHGDSRNLIEQEILLTCSPAPWGAAEMPLPSLESGKPRGTVSRTPRPRRF